MVQHWLTHMVDMVAMEDTAVMLTTGKFYCSLLPEMLLNLRKKFSFYSYSVGYPHGAPHITLHTTGNLGRKTVFTKQFTQNQNITINNVDLAFQN